LAQHHLAVGPGEFDRQPMLLNCPNGTVDLTTGALLPHRPDHLLTRQCPVAYDPGARCPSFEQFLRAAFARDDGLIGYVRRLFGYCLTGSVKEQVLVLLHGPGGNGKTTFLNAVREPMGDYAVKAPRGLLMTRQLESHPTELTTLQGARLVYS